MVERKQAYFVKATHTIIDISEAALDATKLFVLRLRCLQLLFPSKLCDQEMRKGSQMAMTSIKTCSVQIGPDNDSKANLKLAQARIGFQVNCC